MNKIKVRHSLPYSSGNNFLWSEYTLSQIQEHFTKEFETVKKLYPNYDVITVAYELDDYYGSPSLSSTFYGTRDETDAEYEKRLEALKEGERIKKIQAKKSEEKEIALFKRLKAKYENNR